MRCWAFHYHQLAKTSTEIRILDLPRLQVQVSYHHWTPIMRTPCAILRRPYRDSLTPRPRRRGTPSRRIVTFLRPARPRRIPVAWLLPPLKTRSTLQTVHSVLGR